MSTQIDHTHIIDWVSYAPLIFFIALLGGVVAHTYAPMSFVQPVIGFFFGAVLLFGAPVFIIWSQRARHTLYVPVHERTCDHYDVGPYKVSRHPSYLGFFMMLFGFALLINAFVLFLVALVLVPVFTFIIIPKEEAMLIEVCGDAYREYRAKVRMWF